MTDDEMLMQLAELESQWVRDTALLLDGALAVLMADQHMTVFQINPGDIAAVKRDYLITHEPVPGGWRVRLERRTEATSEET